MTSPPKELPVWSIVALEQARTDTAAAVAGRILENPLVPLLPDGTENTAEMTKAALLGLGRRPGLPNALARAAGWMLAWPFERLARPRRLDLSIGEVVCIRDAGRYDLVELLLRVQGELGRPDLELVQPGITFEEAKRGYRWSGLLIEFYAAPRGSGLHPHYLALDPAPRAASPPRSTLTLTVVDTSLRRAGTETP